MKYRWGKFRPVENVRSRFDLEVYEHSPSSCYRRRYKVPRLCYRLVAEASSCQHWHVQIGPITRMQKWVYFPWRSYGSLSLIVVAVVVVGGSCCRERHSDLEIVMTDDKSRDIFPRKKCQVRLNGNIVRYLLSNSPTHWQVLLLTAARWPLPSTTTRPTAVSKWWRWCSNF